MLVTETLIRQLGALPPKSAKCFGALLHERRFDEGSYLLQQGERATWCFFMTHGLVREYYLDANGTEHVRAFVGENGFTGSLYDLLSGKPAVTFIQALEPVVAQAFSYQAFSELCEEHPSLMGAALRFTQRLYEQKARREYELLSLSATERHERWLEAERPLDARVRRKDLASYLGVTPEHLSRLRAAHGRKRP